MSAALPSLPPLDNTFGALFLGCVISVLLYGMSVVQCLYYYTRHPKDVWYLRLLVAVVFIFDTMPVILVIHSMYHYLIKEFADPAALAYMVWSLLLEVAFAALIAVLVQGFYTLRVWKMSGSYILTGIIMVLSLTEFGLCILWLAEAMPLKTFQQLLKVSGLTLTGNSLQAAVDTIIAVSICFMLHRSRTGFRQTDVIINRLIFFFVNTGLLTSMLAITVIIFAVASPHSLIYAGCYFCIGRLYTNSLLAALNGREIIHGKAEDIDITMASTLARNISGAETGTASVSVVINGMGSQDTHSDTKVYRSQATTGENDSGDTD